MEDPFLRSRDPFTGQPMTLITKVHIDPKGKDSYVELDDGTRLGGIYALSLEHIAGKAPQMQLSVDLRDVLIV